MNHRIEYPRVLCAALAIAAIVGVGDLHAQRFQDVIGAAACVETGLHGVKQLVGGGYVAVGESFSPNGCGTSDALVTVTNAAGGQVWSMSYKMGTNSRATDVLELPTGDLIVCGYGTMGTQCHAAVSNDIFILHLAPNGGVVTWNFYGGAASQEEAWKIIRATVGDNITTFAGDYVVAGSTTNPYPTGPRDGYLLRVNAGLALVWDMQYGGGCGDDYFYGLDEYPTWIPGSGDIVAAGGSTSPPAIATDVFVVRVSGNNGTIGAAPQNASWTNLPPVSNLSIEEARSVVILRNPPNLGDIVTTGFTTGAPAPSGNEEVFMLELSPDPCTQVANLYFGDNGTASDRGYDLVEDANPVIATGDVAVTGYTNLFGGFGGNDVFLQRVTTGPGMALAVACMDYGGTGNDEGWSIGNATNGGAGQTPGYIINGVTQSPNLIGADPQQEYLIKADVLQSSLCNNIALTFPSGSGPNGTVCGVPQTTSIGLQCQPNISKQPWQWTTQLCFAFPQARDGGNGGNDGAAGVETPATITFTEGHVTPFPNPLPSGDALNLRFELKSAATARIAISDIAGRELYRSDVAVPKGTLIAPVSTDHWPAGSYLVRVTIGDASSTARVVVVDK